MKHVSPEADSGVTVTLLDSAPITVSVPAELEVDDPAFIQYVAQEALTLHKQQIKGIDPGSVAPSITWPGSKLNFSKTN